MVYSKAKYLLGKTMVIRVPPAIAPDVIREALRLDREHVEQRIAHLREEIAVASKMLAAHREESLSLMSAPIPAPTQQRNVRKNRKQTRRGR